MGVEMPDPEINGSETLLNVGIYLAVKTA